jgi:hypothetical protein
LAILTCDNLTTMASYTFAVKDQQGQQRKGILQADSQAEAEARLKARGYVEVKVTANEPLPSAPTKAEPATRQPAARETVKQPPVPEHKAEIGAVETTIQVMPALPKKKISLAWRKRLASSQPPDQSKG